MCPPGSGDRAPRRIVKAAGGARELEAIVAAARLEVVQDPLDDGGIDGPAM